MIPVVWIPDAAAELEQARAWYDHIGPKLGQRFALAVEATVEAITTIHCSSLSRIGADVVRECGAFLTEFSSKCKSIGSWSSPASTTVAIRNAGNPAEDGHAPTLLIPSRARRARNVLASISCEP